jgi:hypothetical protein
VQERLDAEVVQRAAEKDRSLPRAAVRLAIEPRSGARDDLDRVDQLFLPALAHELRDFLRLSAGDDDRLRPAAASLSLVEEHGIGLEVVHAFEIRTVAERPVHRRRRDAEDSLDLIEQLERIACRLIELVDEGQHRQARASGTPRTASASAAPRPSRHRAP